ncbi:MAG: replication initiation protein [Brevibacterium sp.]|nr:replication initiation protein [Brevibacterium sp.]
MILPSSGAESETTTRPSAWTDSLSGSAVQHRDVDLFSPPEAPGIRSCGWTDVQAHTFLAHLDRDAFQASRDRNFAAAWRKDPETGETTPRMYPVGTPLLERCQYAVMTHPQRTAVLVADVDRPSHKAGGQVTDLHPSVFATLDKLAVAGFGPAWVGINPTNGKCQLLWLIDPVYAAEDRSSPNTRLLAVASNELTALLGGDPAFSHRFSRWPLHKSRDPMAYRWHCQHNQIVRLGDLTEQVRTMSKHSAAPNPRKPEQFESGRARIEAARKTAQETAALRELAAQLPEATEVAPAAAGVIEGVRVLWQSPGRAARDETAFRYALATAHRLKARGQRLTDAALIDAYEQGYNVAQSVGADDRQPAIPAMRDRLTMARRIRGYVTHAASTSTGGSVRMSSAGRKALSTLGARGGEASAQRWTDPTQADYQEAARKPLAAANEQRQTSARGTHLGIAAWFLASYSDTGTWPTVQEGTAEFGASRSTILRALKAANVKLPTGRPSKSAQKGVTP